jgi:spore cortex formation protein SpoVR/YcgB (stage V sporulation)
MSRLEIILSAILTLSVLLNVGVFVYARAAIGRLLFVSEELGDLQSMINAFAKHVKSVYELEMFYGDQTLEHLLNHAVSFNEQLETFEFIYALTEEQSEAEENQEDEELSDNTNEAETPAPPQG